MDDVSLSTRNLARLDHILAILNDPTIQQRLGTDAEYFESTARTFGMIIYELPVTRTGLATVAFNQLETYADVKQYGTYDHFVSRQQGGRMIINAFFEGKIKCRMSLYSFIYDSMLNGIIQTTKQENMLLKQYAKQHTLYDWQTAYAECGIVLEPRRKRSRQKLAK